MHRMIELGHGVVQQTEMQGCLPYPYLGRPAIGDLAGSAHDVVTPVAGQAFTECRDVLVGFQRDREVDAECQGR